MPAQTIEARVRQLVRELAPYPVESLSAGSNFEQDLLYDSLALIELAVRIEKAFGLPPISESDAMEIATVGDVEALIARVLDEPGV